MSDLRTITIVAATDAEAIIHVEPADRRSEISEETGYIYGPRCAFAHTLPIRIKLSSVGDKVWRAIIPDPCSWSPDLPQTYELIEPDAAATGTSAERRQIFGIRRIGLREHHLWFEGKRWVFRGVHRERLPSGDLDWAALRECRLGLVITQPDDELAQMASRQGIPMAVSIEELELPEQQLVWQQFIFKWPAVLLVIASADATQVDLAPAHFPVFARWKSDSPGEANQAVAIQSSDLADARPPQQSEVRPAIILGEPEQYATPQQARTGCERLQQSSAPYGDFAGYIA